MDSKEIISRIRDSEQRREQFYEFVSTVYPGADFKEWFQRGHWDEAYRPYAIQDGDRLVAVVALTRMEVLVDGQPVSAGQLGTVGTIPDYRGRGLSRYLIEHVLQENSDIGLWFLFANEDVLDFYTRFGFRRIEASCFVAHLNLSRSVSPARRLEVENEQDMRVADDLIRRRLPLTRRFGATDYGFITHWHLWNVRSRHLFYLEDQEALMLVSEGDGVLHVWEVIHSRPLDLEELLPVVVQSEAISQVRYYFPPDELPFAFDEVIPDVDDPLFVRGDFPLDGVAFRLPTTAQT